MCHPARCRTCGKTTWTGCGQHVDQVMARVPGSDRCEGHAGRAATPTGGAGAPGADRRSLVARLLGR